MTMHEEVNTRFPMRKTKAQKEAFRAWTVEKAESLGYAAKVEEAVCLCKNHNVVIGDPDKAKVIVTAHYDTPAVMPIPNFITPRNILVYLVYQLGVVMMFILAAVAFYAAGAALGVDRDLCKLIGLIVYWGMLILLLAGPANRHNANDNTSGVAAVLQLMAQLPEELRDKAAFVLFDNEEKGLLGSSAFAKKYPALRKQALVINLDCVGVGEDILFLPPKKTRSLPAYAQMKEAMEAQTGKQVHFFPLENSVYPSDQAQFKHGIAVCACRKRKGIGYYCSRIHTPKDVECDQVCLDVLADGLSAFIATL